MASEAYDLVFVDCQVFAYQIANTVLDVYQQLPDYPMVSLFNLRNFSFTLDFIRAPLLRVFSWLRVKTWII